MIPDVAGYALVDLSRAVDHVQFFVTRAEAEAEAGDTYAVAEVRMLGGRRWGSRPPEAVLDPDSELADHVADIAMRAEQEVRT